MCTDARFAPATVEYFNCQFASHQLIIECYAGGVVEYAHDNSSRLIENAKYIGIDKIFILLHDDCGYYNHLYGTDGDIERNMSYQMRDATKVGAALTESGIEFEIITCKLLSNKIKIVDQYYDFDDNSHADQVFVYPAIDALASFIQIGNKKYDRYSYYADHLSPNYFGQKEIIEKMLFDINIISLQKHGTSEIIFLVREKDDMEELFGFFTNNYLPKNIRQKCRIEKIHDNQPAYV